jgi:CubicO group peptidase (beta-lactamase class C family)
MRQKIRKILEAGVREDVFAGSVLLVAGEGEVVFHGEAGFKALIPDKEPITGDTIFDLASLTKPLATTLALMKLVDEQRVGLDQPISAWMPTSALGEKGKLTLRLLLRHAAGFVDWKPFYLKLNEPTPEERKRVLRKRVVEEPFAYTPGEGCQYSDLGFMLLEWVIEEVSGMNMPEFLHRSFYGPLELKRTFFVGGRGLGFKEGFDEERFAATEACPWRKHIIRGEVHDENASAVGGYSGHAGLFGTAEEVYRLVNCLREHYRGERHDFLKRETVQEFFKRQNQDDPCTWALGWDTPSPQDSSAGKYFSKNSVGHLGFTGTSVWVDLEKDVVVILLTNRIHPTRSNEKIKAFRPELHDCVMRTLGMFDQRDHSE